jgi:hypothetical protein
VLYQTSALGLALLGQGGVDRTAAS